ncbi:uncharacterized protein A4U43_C05F32310 [Asparagus officinalis]|uniref:Uncharacterized protein n=1 Tax=Asparagus officinalis TaxID=4686 RepID=A0A5P1F1J4_ASPOF|nr:uncharacterized protein A4U43_C05F32310 [Asparagus officinalis]
MMGFPLAYSSSLLREARPPTLFLLHVRRPRAPHLLRLPPAGLSDLLARRRAAPSRLRSGPPGRALRPPPAAHPPSIPPSSSAAGPARRELSGPRGPHHRQLRASWPCTSSTARDAGQEAGTAAHVYQQGVPWTAGGAEQRTCPCAGWPAAAGEVMVEVTSGSGRRRPARLGGGHRELPSPPASIIRSAAAAGVAELLRWEPELNCTVYMKNTSPFFFFLFYFRGILFWF